MTSLLATTELASTALLAGAYDWFRPPASAGAEEVDWLFWFITWVSVAFFIPIVGFMIQFMWKYRHRPGHQAEHSPHHNNTLEATWSLIPLLIVVMIFYWGFVGFIDMRNPPDDAYEINVEAQKWSWAFKYPNGGVDTNLHVPLDRPVKLIMSSSDVLHSLYIPSFRTKMDCVPGKYTTLWFRATQASQDDNGDGKFDYVGEPLGTPEDDFDLFCAEYCGTGHSSMFAKVVVHEAGGFEEYLKKLIDPRSQGTPVKVGETLYKRRGCAQCHSIDGTDNRANGGPSFKGHFGKMHQFADGSSHEMDENYIRESILNPQAKIRKGYRPVMPTFQGQLSNDQIFAIIQYIKSVNGLLPEDWAPLPEEEGAEGEASEPAASAAGEDASESDTAGEDASESDSAAQESDAQESDGEPAESEEEKSEAPEAEQADTEQAGDDADATSDGDSNEGASSETAESVEGA